MAIHLVTGAPGHGKSYEVVRLIVEKLTKDGRTVYVDINGFDHGKAGTVPFHHSHPDFPDDPRYSHSGRHWHELPDNSIIVLDECQHSFPVRNAASKAPEYISLMETHRHRGIDLYLITQSPKFLDRHIWPLVETHTHLRRPKGASRSQKFVWDGVNEDPNPSQSIGNSVRESVKFESKYWDYYVSATTHNVRFRLPMFLVKRLGFAVVVLAGSIYWLYSMVSTELEKASKSARPPSTQVEVAAVPQGEKGSACAFIVGAIADLRIYESTLGHRFLAPWVPYGEPLPKQSTHCDRS